MANQYWSPHTVENHQSYNAHIIEDIYYKEISKSEFSIRRIMMLEFSQYLENYLWPNYQRGVASHAHMMSIVVMLNEKFRERVDAWVIFNNSPKEFPDFFQQVLEACLAKQDFDSSHLREQTALILFLNHCFNSMEVSLCRDQAKRLVSLAMWSCLQPSECFCSYFDKKKYISNKLLNYRKTRARTESLSRMEKILEEIAKTRQTRIKRKIRLGTTFFTGNIIIVIF